MKKLMPANWLLIWLTATLILRLVLPGPQMVPAPWNLLGLVPVALGVWMNLAADKAIHLAHTTVKPFEEPSALITDGVYGFTRNPMYLGFVGILIGVAVVLDAWTAIVPVIAFIGIMHVLFINPEGQSLRRNFGAAWEEYERTVGRWL
jgi:protein-S-isoprenylcysteine O-methyltransferase Ste14